MNIAVIEIADADEHTQKRAVAALEAAGISVYRSRLASAFTNAIDRIQQALLSDGQKVKIINDAVKRIKNERTHMIEYKNIRGEIEKVAHEALTHLPKADRNAAIDKFITDFIRDRVSLGLNQ